MLSAYCTWPKNASRNTKSKPDMTCITGSLVGGGCRSMNESSLKLEGWSIKTNMSIGIEAVMSGYIHSQTSWSEKVSQPVTCRQGMTIWYSVVRRCGVSSSMGAGFPQNTKLLNWNGKIIRMALRVSNWIKDRLALPSWLFRLYSSKLPSLQPNRLGLGKLITPWVRYSRIGLQNRHL